jgi:hypothetical protein
MKRSAHKRSPPDARGAWAAAWQTHARIDDPTHQYSPHLMTT